MKGSNAMILNTATMIKIIQHYFDNVLFKDSESPNVADFKANTGAAGPTFEVKITDEIRPT